MDLLYNIIVGLYVALLVLIDSFMDFCNFYRRRNVGFICIHTLPTYFEILGIECKIKHDAWHWTKKLFWLLLITGLIFVDITVTHLYAYLAIAIRLALINLTVHDYTLHKIFKKYSNHDYPENKSI